MVIAFLDERVSLVGLMLGVALPMTSAPALAQPHDGGGAEANVAGEESRQRARHLFDRGVEALRRESYREAQDLFERSLALAPRDSTAFNLSGAYRKTGDIRKAVQLLERLVDGDFGRLEGEQRESVQDRLRQARAALAKLAVSVESAQAATILVDGETVGRSSDGMPVQVALDPGEHRVLAVSGSRRTLRRIRLPPGGERHLTLTMSPAVTGAAGDGKVDEQDSRRPTALWIVGALVVAAGVAAAVAVPLRRGREDDAGRVDPIFGRTRTLRVAR